MWFTRVSLQNPVFATMVMLALVVLGLFSYQRLQIDQFPNIDFPVVVVITEISLITPPVGLNVFVLRGVLGDVSTGTIFRGVTPFWIFDIFRLALLVLFPWIVLIVPWTMQG